MANPITPVEALRKIRTAAYGAKFERAQQATLDIARIAEAAITAAEKLAKEAQPAEDLTDRRTPAIGIQKPIGVSEWAWNHHSFLDLNLWQNSLVACAAAGAVDIVGAARKKYEHLGGERVSAYVATRKPQVCPNCKGKGFTPSPAGSKFDRWPCAKCDSTGKVVDRA